MGEKEVKVLVNVGSFRLFFLGRFRRLLISGIKCFKVTYIVLGYALVCVCSPLTGLDTNGVRCLLPLLGLRWFSLFSVYYWTTEEIPQIVLYVDFYNAVFFIFLF